MSKKVEETRRLYLSGALKLSTLQKMLKAGKFTQEEFDYITAPAPASEEE